MTDQFIVVTGEGKDITAYGPMGADIAGEFAQYMSSEVDPAWRLRLLSPTHELINYWRNNKCTCVETTVPNTDVVQLTPGRLPCPTHPRPDAPKLFT